MLQTKMLELVCECKKQKYIHKNSDLAFILDYVRKNPDFYEFVDIDKICLNPNLMVDDLLMIIKCQPPPILETLKKNNNLILKNSSIDRVELNKYIKLCIELYGNDFNQSRTVLDYLTINSGIDIKFLLDKDMYDDYVNTALNDIDEVWYSLLSCHHNFDISWIQTFNDKDWCYDILTYRLTIDSPTKYNKYLLNNPTKIKKMNMSVLSRWKELDFDIVRQNPDENWNYEWLTSHPHCTQDDIHNLRHKSWSYLHLSGSDICFNLLIKHPEIYHNKPWKWWIISTNTRCLELINRLPRWYLHKLDFKKVSIIEPSNKKDLYDVLDRYPDKNWNYSALSVYEFLYPLVLKYPDKDWDMDYILSNNYDDDVYISKQRTQKRIKLIEEDLIQTTLQPKRVRNWMDESEYKEICSESDNNEDRRKIRKIK